jgi:hypothetical protein
MEGRAAAALSMLLGIWLVLSAAFWSHLQPQFTNALVVGCLLVGFAACSLAVPSARFMNTGLSLWLLVSTFVLPTATMATTLHNGVVAIAAFFFSLMGTSDLWQRRAGQRGPRQAEGSAK